MTEDNNTKKNKTESFPCEGNRIRESPVADLESVTRVNDSREEEEEEEEEEDENAYWENMRIQDEIDEMNDRDREMDEMMERIEREEEKKEREEERKHRIQEICESLEELRKNLTFIESADGKLELVKRDDCNPQMNIHIHKVN